MPKKNITVDDLWKIERLGAPSLSPDGAQAVATLTRYAMAGVFVSTRKFAHGLGALGQLDQHHPDIFHHRQQHFAQRLDMGALLALVAALGCNVFADLAHAGDTVHQPGHPLTEAGCNFG